MASVNHIIMSVPLAVELGNTEIIVLAAVFIAVLILALVIYRLGYNRAMKKLNDEANFIYCSKCGVKNHKEVNYCSKCGHKLP